MSHARPDPTRRFSNRVDDYVRFRPRYPVELLDILRDVVGLTPSSVIADVGSGTGISAELFLAHGNSVFAVEPNREMRGAAETALEHFSRFHSIDGAAEATTLPDRSVDLVTAGQAFHWFDADRAAGEFARILRPGGQVVLFWNTRRLHATPFLRAYEQLLQLHGTDYREVQHGNINDGRLRKFFAAGEFQARSLYHEQRLDFESLRGRLLSSSYTPAPHEAGHEPMLRALREIWDAHQQDGSVCLEYDCQIYVGSVHPPRA